MSSDSEVSPGEGGNATPATEQPWRDQGNGKEKDNEATEAREVEGELAGHDWSVVRRRGKRKGKRRGKPKEGGREHQGSELEGQAGQHQGAEGLLQHQGARDLEAIEAGLCGMMLLIFWCSKGRVVQ